MGSYLRFVGFARAVLYMAEDFAARVGVVEPPMFPLRQLSSSSFTARPPSHLVTVGLTLRAAYPIAVSGRG